MNKIVEFLIENISTNLNGQISSLVNSPKYLRKNKQTNKTQMQPKHKALEQLKNSELSGG